MAQEWPKSRANEELRMAKRVERSADTSSISDSDVLTLQLDRFASHHIAPSVMKTFPTLSVLVAALMVCSSTTAFPVVKCGFVTPTAAPNAPASSSSLPAFPTFMCGIVTPTTAPVVPAPSSSVPTVTPSAPVATIAPMPASNITTAPAKDETGGEGDDAAAPATVAPATFAPATIAPADVAPATTTPATSTPTSSTPAAPATGSTKAVSKSAGCDKTATIKSGTFTATINGKERQYTVRVPTNYDSSKAYRFVLAFHWLGGTMQNVAGFGGYYGLQSLSAESTIFVAPQGLNNAWPNSGGEDLAFVDYLVKTIDEGLCVNQNLRFATGFSYGGSMTHSVACSRAKDFRGVAVLSGGQFSGCSDGNTPIAYLITHGVSDTTIPIAQMRSMRDKFVKTNGCTAQNAAEPAAGSGTHIKTEYQGCSAGHPVVAIAFDGSHTFSPADKGARTFAPAETWNFFSQFS